jgi:hypothetical protein
MGAAAHQGQASHWAPLCFPGGRSKADFASPGASPAPVVRRMGISSFSAPAC